MNEVIVRLKEDMPLWMHGVTLLDSDDNYNVYINANLSIPVQREALCHEMEHIQKDDFYNDAPIQKVEHL